MMKTPLRVLMVEDDEHDLLLMLRTLEEHGFEVVVSRAANAADMEHALRSAEFDVVLADYRLPRFSAPEALELLHRLELDLPFILVSAVVGDEVAVDIMRRGARDYITKDHLPRLGHAVEREVREYAERRGRAEREFLLARMQRRFQETFEHAPIGIVHTDTSGRIFMANRRLCEILGYSREELLGRLLTDLTESEFELDPGWLTDLVAGRRPTHEGEKCFIRRDGSSVWVSFTAKPIRSEIGDMDYLVGMVEDITRRKMAEAQIRFQAHLLDAVKQSVIATDLEGRVTFWSRHSADVYGWSAAEALGRSLLELTAPPATRGEALLLLKTVARGASWSGELEVQHRDGRMFPAMVVASPIFGEHAKPLGIVAISFDVSDRKAAAAALILSEERYRGVMEGVDELILSVDPDGTINNVNPAFERSTGWSRDEIVGRPLSALVPPDAGEALQARGRAGARGEVVPPRERLMKRRNGSLLPVETVEFARRQHGAIAEIFYFCRDLTARNAAQQERERLANELRLLLESTAEGIYAVDAEGKCTLVNRAATQILGYPEELVLGRDSHELFHHTRADGTRYSHEDCPLHRVLRTGSTERMRDEMFWRSDGAAIPVEYACAPILDRGVIVGAVTTFTDVSERRLLETQLERANRVNSLGRVAATMAHEMNNVLMGIQPFAETLRRYVSEPRPASLIDAIEKSVRRGARITGEILRFTRQAKPVLKPMNVAQVVDDLAVEARAVLESAVALEVRNVHGLLIAADSRELHQALLNLIVNARDAGARRIAIAAELTLQSRYSFGVLEPGEYVHFSVKDDGNGMPPHVVEHVFEPLFTTKKSGTGLGLALAHNVVKQHGGSIFVESAEGAGTTFHIFVPVAGVFTPAQETAATAVPPNVHTIVVVEDEPEVAAGIVALLELDGLAIAVARNGDEAIDVIERVQPDAVILDIGLPDIDGTEIYERIARLWPTLPVIFASGHTDASRLAEYLTRPNVVSMTKPYEVAELYSALHVVLQGGMSAAPQFRAGRV